MSAVLTADALPRELTPAQRALRRLVRRRGMVKLWMDRTCGMFGRSPDFLNVMLTGLAAASPEFGRRSPLI